MKAKTTRPETQFSRTEMIYGTDALEKLKESKVAVFGAGGVGGYVIEALARSGVGTIAIVDNDTVTVSNINRQIFALHSTIGLPKTEVAKARVLDINPRASVIAHNLFYLPDSANQIDLQDYSYVVDAIDTVTAKIFLATECERLGVPLISSMGTGNKTDPSKLQITDIYKTSVCPLARVMRSELKKRNIKKLKVVFSTELPAKISCTIGTDLVSQTIGTDLVGQTQNNFCESSRSVPGSTAFVPSVRQNLVGQTIGTDLVGQDLVGQTQNNFCESSRSVPGSTAFVPSVAGLLIASEVVKDLLKM